ncbi:hypothetical protein K443DRAFT_116354, partial [Laccaria amethystina LaAM-08-1]
SRTPLDTYTLREDAPKIRLRNGYALVELSLTLLRFACSGARLGTYTLPEDAPQIRLQNG